MNTQRRVLTAQQLTELKVRYPLFVEQILTVFDRYAEWHEDPVGQTDLALRAAMENETNPLDEMRREHVL